MQKLSKKNVKRLKTIFITTINLPLAIILSLFVVNFILHVIHYNDMQKLDAVMYDIDIDTITIDGINYHADIPLMQNKAFDYAYKGKIKNSAIHAVSSDNYLVSLYRDFIVYKSIDDPNCYVIQQEPSVFDESFLYYAENMVLPQINKNEIRSIYITEKGKAPDLNEHCINEVSQIAKITDCILNNLDPTEFVKESGFDVSTDYEIWYDYCDFPLYQKAYSSDNKISIIN